MSDGYEQAQAQLDSIRAMVLRVEHANDYHDIDGCDLAEECPRCEGHGGIECVMCNGDLAIWHDDDYDGMSFDDYHDADAACTLLACMPGIEYNRAPHR